MDWTLFFTAFLSATLLPGGSEALLLFRLQSAPDPLIPVLTATAGNLLGSLLTYAIGRGGNAALHARWLRIDDAALQRAERWFDRWGRPALLLAWLPVVGDPLCLLAGLLRVSILWFTLLVGVGKLLRYAAIAVLAS
ncbi:MAG: DedA family protein [Gammaproteobacteria bacterium]|nr:DedA family protein [Gammaproteobacteria bacterium]MCB1924037.1 DedA family protein [Gammaproteobacteria bacterium]